MSTIVCKKCNKEKSITEFYADKKSSTGKRSWCKKCDNKRKLEWNKRNSEYRKKYNRERYKKFKKQVVDYLGGECAVCGIIDDVCIYDVHHLDPSKKEFNIGDPSYSVFDKIKSELNKCILVCANCHRRIHWGK